MLAAHIPPKIAGDRVLLRFPQPAPYPMKKAALAGYRRSSIGGARSDEFSVRTSSLALFIHYSRAFRTDKIAAPR
jgi:hypothetical protein